MHFRPEEDAIILANPHANSCALAAALTAAGFSRNAGSVRNRRMRLLERRVSHPAASPAGVARRGRCNPYAEDPERWNLHRDDEHVQRLLADPEHRRCLLWAAWAGRMLERRR